MTETDVDVYRAPLAPPPPAVRRPWRKPLAVATVPSLVYSLTKAWLPSWLATVFWIVVVVLTFYGVGAFVWSAKKKPTWARAMLVALLTGVWMAMVSFTTSLLVGLLGDLG